MIAMMPGLKTVFDELDGLKAEVSSLKAEVKTLRDGAVDFQPSDTLSQAQEEKITTMIKMVINMSK